MSIRPKPARSAGARWSGHLLALAIALAIFEGRLPQASAATVNWTDGTSNWSTAANWTTPPSTHNVPGAGDTVSIAPTDGVSRTITYDYTGAAVTLGSLTIDLTGGSGSATTTLSMAANNLTAGSENIGQSGSGTLNQSGGTNTDNGGFGIGSTASANGTYNLSGTGVFVAKGGAAVGLSGTGTFNQSGGSATVAVGNLNIGYNSGSNGTYNLSGGSTTITNGNVFVGGNPSAAGGTGTLTVSGTGTLTTSSTTNITVYNTAGSGLTLSGGTITTGSLNLSGNVGLFNWTAGTLNLTSTTSNFIVDNSDGTLGATFNLGDGQTLTVASSEIVGDIGTGTVNQTGGTHTVSTWLYLGNTEAISLIPGGNGTYTLSGGTLNSPETSVGYHGAGTFTQSGGTFNSTSFITVGDQDGGNGTFNLNGGTLNGATLNLGYSSGFSSPFFSLPAGTGTFNQTAGSATFTTLVLGQNVGASGFYNLVGSGSLTVNSAGGTETIGNSGIGQFFQAGGTNTLTSGTALFVAAGGSSTGDYSINGGTLTLAGNAYIGGSSSGAGGAGTLAISGNAVVSILGAGTLKIWNTAGTIVSFAGGTLSAGAIDVSGNTAVLNWTSGKLTLTATNLVFDPTIAGAANSPFSANTTLNSSQTLQVTGGTETIGGGGSASLTLNSATNTVSGNATIQTNGTLTLSGITTLTVGGGTGNLINLGLFVFNAGTFNARLVNEGETTFTTSFVAADGIENESNISLFSTQVITANGAGFSNDGTLTLNGGIVAGAQVTNNSDGVVVGPGTISAPFANSGLLNVPNGTTKVGSFTNSGVITISGFGAELGPGGTITNNATIQGFGEVSDAVVNHATIRPFGGTLAFTGSVTNSASGLISIPASGELLMQGSSNFPTNAGTISLAGGVFDNGGQTLSNTGQITGYGILSTGGLTNNGTFTLTGGTTTVNGNITNSAGQTINIKYQPAIFTGNITNNGTIKATSTTVTYTGTYTGNAYISDPASNIFQNNVTIVSGGSMTGGTGDVYSFSGGAFTNNGTFTNGGLLQSSQNSTNSGTFTQSGPQTWSAGTTFTNTAGTATFASDTGSASFSPLSITITGGTVNLAATEHLNALTVTTGQSTITAGTTKTNTLTLGGARNAWTGDLAIGANNLVVEATSLTTSDVLATLQNQAFFGAANPNGITSDALTVHTGIAVIDNGALGSPLTTFGGVAVDANSLLVAPELFGDANIDGVVNAADFALLASNFNRSNIGWGGGDFNNDGVVSFADFALLSNHFGDTIGAGNLAGNGSGTASGVPEPTSAGLLGLAVVGLLTRRRRA